MSLIRADVAVQGVQLDRLSAFQMSRRLRASSAAAMSILYYLVLKHHSHLLLACCTLVAGCMLTLYD